jgi:diguanylate cyclase (GGDEF)-like protein
VSQNSVPRAHLCKGLVATISRIINGEMKRLYYLLFYRWRNRDPLTGLRNGKKFLKDLNSALHSSNRVALILADVDEFRNVNFAHGYEFGDTVLRQMSKALASTCAVSSSLVPYREGGESFSFVLTHEVENSRTVAELLRAEVEQLRFDSHPEVKVTIRLAIAVAPVDGKTVNELWEKVKEVYCHPLERRRNQVV